jgi:release factor glutamine methyltransferase
LLVSALLSESSGKLREAGVTSATVDAELLACFCLGISRSELQLLVATNQEFPDEHMNQFQAVLARRVSREPLQHITGTAPFRHLELKVGPGVFTPRPETEQVVGYAMEKISKLHNPLIVDLCSGSGAIAISLNSEIPGSNVFAVELSKDAFGYLLQNAASYGLTKENLRNEDLQTSLSELDGLVDLVISNPPYIPNDAVPVDLEVQLHEPSESLYGGVDGLDVVRKISVRALKLLKPGGLLVLEHADSQSSAIGKLLLAEGWLEIEARADLAGKERMISAVKPY